MEHAVNFNLGRGTFVIRSPLVSLAKEGGLAPAFKGVAWGSIEPWRVAQLVD